MAILQIPPQLKNGIKFLSLMPEDSFRFALDALLAVPKVLKQGNIFSDFTIAGELLSPEDALKIKELVFSLHLSLVNNTEIIVDTFVNDLAESAITDEEPTSGDIQESLRSRLKKLLSLENLQLIAKAHSVLIEHEHSFNNARIFSDIRMVFLEKPEEKPSGAVVVHNLQLTYTQAGEMKEFFIALDSKDIDALAKQLERAKAKTESLKSAIQSSDIYYMDVV